MSFTSGADVLSGLPGAFQAALHGALTAKHYEQAIRDTMSCGGCTSSRGSFIGACMGAQVGLCANLTFIIIIVVPASYVRWFIKCAILNLTDWTWGSSSFLDIQNPALWLCVGACQEDNQTPPVVCFYNLRWLRTKWQTVELSQSSEWRFLSKLLDGKSRMILSPLKLNMLIQMFSYSVFLQ